MICLNVLHIKRIIHISANTDNGGKSIVHVCVYVCVQSVCFGAKSMSEKQQLFTVCADFQTLSVLFPAARTAHHFITPPAVSAQ